jgi:DNA-binding response OmpR family regulator
MSDKDFLKGIKILIADDEPDVLQVLEELLQNSDVVKANNFEEASLLLTTQNFDIAILDIMGIDGYALLDIAKQQNVLAIMLTAHALSPEETVRSFQKGAASYVPKDEISNIAAFLNDALEAHQKGKSSWSRWLDRLGAYYEKKFGPRWQDHDKDFWERFPRHI